MQSDAHIYAVICTSMRMWKSHAHFMHLNITNICHLMRIDFYRGTSWLQRHSSLLIGFPEQRSMHLAIAGKQRQIKTSSTGNRNKTWMKKWKITGWGCKQRKIGISSLASAARPPLRCFGGGSGEKIEYTIIHISFEKDWNLLSTVFNPSNAHLWPFPWYRTLENGGSNPET